ncbi:RlpA-like double-psi beta-barrel-protein domain-containing protein-containing protein [Hygrophoropsis aurantiaca]|uniref:RlpA-like double-psi beta-barrel-protein domain-containing protein-containing protein n=1 Tax=Hygrophoropsis aurantiaca TaxID=72124 RepID=A0ACB8AIC0_9AGAM|nr:RlpA-like double-psi beta-barrel-protein domain-containing protein-containing protein [Hygrophoropsis aurantiaca]
MVSKLFLAALTYVVAACAQASSWNVTQHGEMFHFVPGLGACGYTNDSTRSVASVSLNFFNSFPGSTDNPNDNPICTHHLNVTYNGTTVVAQIVDLCIQCADNSVGLSSSAFAHLADLRVGIVKNVTWVVDST